MQLKHTDASSEIRPLSDAGSGEDRSADQMPHAGRLTEVLFGPLGILAMRNLRVRPRQARSIKNVERILSTAAEMTFHRPKPGSISIDEIANVAGVTPQATYRYFKDVEELIRTGLRCVVIREHERVIAVLSGRLLLDETEMARTVVSAVLDTCERMRRLPSHVQEHILLEYRQVGYDASLLMSEIICRDVADADIRRTLDVVKGSVALTATVAVATSLFFRNMSTLSRSRLESVLADLFVNVLQSGGSSADAFHDIECQVGRMLRGKPD